MSKEAELQTKTWVTVGRPGFLGKNKDQQIAAWDAEYGKDNWRLVWQMASGEVLDYPGVFAQYIESYADYFRLHMDEALYLTQNFAYAYDKELVTKEEAFDPLFLFEKPGHPNQFHNVALNIALENILNLAFQGENPIQVREGKPDTDPTTWPSGWRWSPGRIPASHPENIPQTEQAGWWQSGTVEHLYQASKVPQIKK
ncbi:MAG TPA: hypothetical protein PLI45_02910 [Candidatus Woesebacteria bacterium]|nr:hypothetical protein [Candidatus Woesebacteria bacterium]